MNFGESHYTSFKIEPIDVMRDWMTHQEYEGWLRGNVIKYIARYKGKGGIIDLRKAQDYLMELIEHVSREEVK